MIFQVGCILYGHKTLVSQKMIYLAGIIQGEPTQMALWLQFVSILQQVSEATKETQSLTLIDCQTAFGGLCNHGFEMDILDMAFTSLMMSKLSAIIKAKDINEGLCSHEGEVKAAKGAYGWHIKR